MRVRKGLFRLLSAAVATLMLTSVIAPAVQAAVFTLLSPQAGQNVSGSNVEVAVGFNTQSDLKVTKLELWIDGYLLAVKSLTLPVSRGVGSFWWNTTDASSGLHNIVVKIYARDRLLGSARGSATVGRGGYDFAPPALRIANVKAGQVISGKTNLQIVCSDDSDLAPIVTLLVDDKLKLLSNARPCVYELDTTQYPDGEHELQVVAYDSSGNKSDMRTVKVVFRNGIERPVAAAPEIKQPITPPPSEDDYLGPIAPIEAVAPSSFSGSAARTEPDKVVSATPPKPAQAAAKPLAKPKVSHEPVKIVPQARAVEMPSVARAPVVVAKAPLSGSAPIVKTPATRATPASPTAADSPKAPNASAVQQTNAAKTQPNKQSVVKQPSAPKPLKAALLLSSDVSKRNADPALVPPRPVARDTNARLEKRTVSVCGKVKLRDWFNRLGGVLVWDAKSRTVTAYAPGVRMQFRIGSPIVIVNNKPVKCDSAPTLVNGRTFIDSSVCHQALELYAPVTVSMLF